MDGERSFSVAKDNVCIRDTPYMYVGRAYTHARTHMHTHNTRSLSPILNPAARLSVVLPPPGNPRSSSRRRSNGVFNSGNRLSVAIRHAYTHTRAHTYTHTQIRARAFRLGNCHIRVPRTYRVVRNGQGERQKKRREGERKREAAHPVRKDSSRSRTVPRGEIFAASRRDISGRFHDSLSC